MTSKEVTWGEGGALFSPKNQARIAARSTALLLERHIPPNKAYQAPQSCLISVTTHTTTTITTVTQQPPLTMIPTPTVTTPQGG